MEENGITIADADQLNVQTVDLTIEITGANDKPYNLGIRATGDASNAYTKEVFVDEDQSSSTFELNVTDDDNSSSEISYTILSARSVNADDSLKTIDSTNYATFFQINGETLSLRSELDFENNFDTQRIRLEVEVSDGFDTVTEYVYLNIKYLDDPFYFRNGIAQKSQNIPEDRESPLR